MTREEFMSARCPKGCESGRCNAGVFGDCSLTAAAIPKPKPKRRKPYCRCDVCRTQPKSAAVEHHCKTAFAGGLEEAVIVVLGQACDSCAHDWCQAQRAAAGRIVLLGREENKNAIDALRRIGNAKGDHIEEALSLRERRERQRGIRR